MAIFLKRIAHLLQPFSCLITHWRREKSNGNRTAAAVLRNSSCRTLAIESLEPRLCLATGLAAGYAFNEISGNTAADASGHAIVGSLTNGPTFVAGKYGNAVNLDGVNDYVDLGNPAALQLTGSLTVSG